VNAGTFEGPTSTIKRTVWIGVDVVSEVIEGEAVLLNLSTGRYFSLNVTGTFIWQQIELHGDVKQINTALLAKYPADPTQAMRDITDLLNELVSRDLVRRQ